MSVTSVRFVGFKALRDYSIALQSMNVLVGPNNSGKSTILSAFRVLEQAMRTAGAKKPTRVMNHLGQWASGHSVPESTLPISLENVHSDYETEDSRIEFRFSNSNRLTISFPSDGGCYVYWTTTGPNITTPTGFRRAFPLQVQVIPVLGPVEQDEEVVTDETVRRSAGTPRASRHFRNFWWKNQGGFDAFRSLVDETWPGMSIGRPELVSTMERRLVMFCSENRIDRELFWAGLGFQVWCQLLTHISRASSADLLVVDEPEVYLHPDVQRQLLGILRDIQPHIILATHSTEILGEADPSEILLVDKSLRSAKRLKDAEGVQQALDAIGSIQNITLTQLARNKRLIFVEGLNDYKILRRFARNFGLAELAAGAGLTPLESGGFESWPKVRALAWGFRKTLGDEVQVGAIYDRDYWCSEEIDSLTAELRAEIHYAHFHGRKEIENYLVLPAPLYRLVARLAQERNIQPPSEDDFRLMVAQLAEKFRNGSQGQYVSRYCDFHRSAGRSSATLTSEAIARFEEMWRTLEGRLAVLPGKEYLKVLRERCQETWSVTLTDVRLIDAVRPDEFPDDLVGLLRSLNEYQSASNAT